ncbi:MBL fold metallo-hydrolase, partial [Staphylococcus aureus]
CLDHIHPVARDGMLQLGDGVEVQYTPAGHILGASSVRIAHEGRSVLFSGDLGREDDQVMLPPTTGQVADWVVIESTYGDRQHIELDPAEQLGDIVRRT